VTGRAVPDTTSRELPSLGVVSRPAGPKQAETLAIGPPEPPHTPAVAPAGRPPQPVLLHPLRGAAAAPASHTARDAGAIP
jgi:hypothetical protein